jgi:hypothetical protein
MLIPSGSLDIGILTSPPTQPERNKRQKRRRAGYSISSNYILTCAKKLGAFAVDTVYLYGIRYSHRVELKIPEQQET